MPADEEPDSSLIDLARRVAGTADRAPDLGLSDPAKMQDNATCGWPRSRFDAFTQPFRLLGTGPAATSAQIQAAYVLAVERRAAPEEALADARTAVLEPAQRLSCELTYPIDSSPAQIETFYAGLSGDTSEKELLLIANQLPPLSLANFVAHLAALLRNVFDARAIERRREFINLIGAILVSLNKRGKAYPWICYQGVIVNV